MQIIAWSIPGFMLLIAIEAWLARRRGLAVYHLPVALSDISCGITQQLFNVLSFGLTLAVYAWVYQFHLLEPQGAALWLIGMLGVDFFYYWWHRASHEVNFLWASHIVHHHSEDYNLAVALRQALLTNLSMAPFLLPLALLGVPPLVYAACKGINSLYQFWLHTELIGKLGRFERVFNAPSLHRVHHATNPQYLDKNYGGILIVWDRLFGSFREEDEKCVYGTRSPLRSWDPLWANGEVYWALLRDSWRTRAWADKLRVWFKPPGWRPADVAALDPQPAFDITQVQRFQPPLARGTARFAAGQFVLLLGASATYLWQVDGWPLATAVVWLLALTASLWAVGALIQGRISAAEVLLIEACALATASSALGLRELHLLFKPLAMLIALALTWGVPRALWLRLALLGSLAGDVFLMLPGLFIPGLVAFLLAHIAYIVRLRQDAPWFAHRAALLATLGVGAVMYTGLWWGGLPPALRVPVAAYVVVIALMAAQAMGRASVLRDRASVLVAVGAASFMLSDSLLAINRFVTPLPMAQLGVLSSYYAAQCLMVGGLIRARPA